MRIAPEGWPFIAIAWGLVALTSLLGATLVAWLLVPIAIWTIAFFRDPVREGPRGDNLVIAPADGKVVSIITIDEPEVIGGSSTRISIFMNVFNVHVNRYPITGEITFRRHSPGKFLNAASEKASTENEQSDIGMQGRRGPVLVRQIAGLVARRIVTDHEVGARVAQAERLGLIRFGSRVDVFLPAGVAPRVQVGDQTLAGKSVIAEWHE